MSPLLLRELLIIFLSVIFFECMDLSLGQRVNVSGLACVSKKVLGCWDRYRVIYDIIHHQNNYMEGSGSATIK